MPSRHWVRRSVFACSRIGSLAAQNDSITVNVAGSALLKNSPGQLESIVITNTGVAGASLELFDAIDGAGVPFATLDMTDALVGLQFNRRLNNGLFFSASGTNFEVLINWR